jgi:rRNA maturation endonuclease Nob1
MNTAYSTNSSNYSSIVNDASIETGRVEKGDKSGQSFEDGYGTFNSWASYTTTVQVIPLSQKPVEAQEIRSYCTGCGSRIKKQTWKFCPNCGTEAI